ncbi:MAG: metallophosphoesterase [Sedimentisphaerales bacterium]|nr:metallophosphoesterase [Sedimentisphaerales bacterium]
MAAFTGLAGAGYPPPVGLWQFDDPDHLNQGTVGLDLMEVGSHNIVAGIDAEDGAVEDPLVGYYICPHGIAPNGGGVYVNNWTVLMDIKVPSASLGHWMTLYQTNTANNNDGDCFIAPGGTIGVGATGYSSNTVNSETWYRIVISVSNGSFYRIYVNGQIWLDGIPQVIDGRFSLDPEILFFADDSSEDYPIHCTNLATWEQALSATQVSELAGPTTPIELSIVNQAGYNLLTNYSADDDLSDWTIEQGYDWQATDRTDWHFPHTGTYYFAPGMANQAQMSQIINLSALASSIDAGEVVAMGGGSIGSYGGNGQGRIIIEYRNASEVVIATSDSGWITGAEGEDWTFQTLPDANGLVLPAGTRSAKYRLLAERTVAGEGHAYFDDLFWEFRFSPTGNTDPDAPVVAGPGSGSTGSSLTYTFSTTDGDGDTVSYQIDWGHENSNWSEYLSSGTNYVVQHSFPLDGNYRIRARARDENGAVGDWSTPLDVIITGAITAIYKSEPYLQNVSQSAITIAWESDRLVNPWVEWGPTEAYGYLTNGLCINAGSGVYICKVRLTGLDPQTAYHYRRYNGATPDVDNVFQTAPLESTPFRFGVWGDSQQETANPAVSYAIFTDMAAEVDFGVTVGDIVQDYTYSYFTNPFRKYLCDIFGHQKPFYTAFGNHDEPLTSFVHKALQNSGMYSCSFNYGNAHFTCIDYSQLNDGTLPYDGSISSLPLEWIQEDLASDAAQHAAWRFLLIHVPPYSERWIDGSSLMRTYLAPLMNDYRVHICFSGHVHEYERGFLDGVYYVITGCCSYLDTYEPVVADWPHMTVGGAHDIGPFIGGCVHGYTTVDINDTELVLTQHGYNSSGSYYGVIDSFTIAQADFNYDQVIDMGDFSTLANSWLLTPQDTGWNSDCDLADRAAEIVDVGDLAVLARYWLLELP